MPDPAMFVAVGVMVGVYVLIASEKMHRTTATMLGVAVLLAVHFLVSPFAPALRIWDPERGASAAELFETIIPGPGEWSVVLLLFGMMVIVAVTEKTGIFQFLAFKAYELARGRVVPLVLLLCGITAFLSAWLDNVTTVLLVAPVAIEICAVLGMKPLPVLLPVVFASNIGGTATLVGDPPNILVGLSTGISFNEFLVALAPGVLLSMVAFFGVILWMYRRDYRHEVADVAATTARLREEYAIRDWRPVVVCLSVISFVVLLFFLQRVLGMEVSLAALLGAGVLLAVSRQDLTKTLAAVEWPTLMFFVTLFMIVGAVEETGFLQAVAQGIERASGGSFVVTLLLIIWVSALLSAFVDNIPFVATMIPVVNELIPTFSAEGAAVHGLWWALLFGADFGGNATIVGASANIVTAGLLDRAGHHVTFLEFMKRGFPVMIVTCLVATAYVLARYGGVL